MLARRDQGSAGRHHAGPQDSQERETKRMIPVPVSNRGEGRRKRGKPTLELPSNKTRHGGRGGDDVCSDQTMPTVTSAPTHQTGRRFSHATQATVAARALRLRLTSERFTGRRAARSKRARFAADSASASPEAGEARLADARPAGEAAANVAAAPCASGLGGGSEGSSDLKRR